MSYSPQFESMTARAERLNAAELKALNPVPCPLKSDGEKKSGCSKCYRGPARNPIPHKCDDENGGCGAINMHTTGECVQAKLRGKSAGITSRFEGCWPGMFPMASRVTSRALPMQQPCHLKSNRGTRDGCSRCWREGLPPKPHRWWE